VVAAARHNPVIDCSPTVVYFFPIHGLSLPLKNALHKLGVKAKGEIVDHHDLYVESEEEEEEDEIERGEVEEEKGEKKISVKWNGEKNEEKKKRIEKENDKESEEEEEEEEGNSEYFDYSSSSSSSSSSASSSSSSSSVSISSFSFLSPSDLLPPSLGVIGDQEPKRPAVNLDVTALISLSTNMCYGGAIFSYKQKILSFQVPSFTLSLLSFDSLSTFPSFFCHLFTFLTSSLFIFVHSHILLNAGPTRERKTSSLNCVTIS